MKDIFVTRPSMPSFDEYVEAIRPLWDSHWLTNMGIYHKELETKLREYLDVPELSLMVNGHMALELTIQAFGFPEGAEVITTPFTFISTTHAILRNRLKPVFCDIKPEDGTIDETKIEDLVTDRTVAIVPVHVYGNICNVEEIDRIAKKYGLKVIYDAAHAFGEEYKGIKVGNFGDASIFSFHATKVFNTIEGGAVTFKDKMLYEKLYNLKNFGIRGTEMVVEIGANAKMNEFAAIMGLCNLKHITEEIEKRKKRVGQYRCNLSKIEGINLCPVNQEIKYNYAYLPIRVDSINYGSTRNAVFEYLRGHNIVARKYFYPLITEQICLKDKFEGTKVDIAKRISEEVLTLPLYADLDCDIVDYICGLLQDLYEKHRK